MKIWRLVMCSGFTAVHDTKPPMAHQFSLGVRQALAPEQQDRMFEERLALLEGAAEAAATATGDRWRSAGSGSVAARSTGLASSRSVWFPRSHAASRRQASRRGASSRADSTISSAGSGSAGPGPAGPGRQSSDGDCSRISSSSLRSAGWQPPVPFVVKARDGETDLHGHLFRPTDFDEDLIDHDELRRDSRYRPLVLMGSELPFPFELTAAPASVAGLPPTATAGLALLEEWGMPSRLASLAGFVPVPDGRRRVVAAVRRLLDG